MSTNLNGIISIKQELNDINETAPEISISPGQSGIVTAWILDAASEFKGGRIELRKYRLGFLVMVQRQILSY